MRWMNYGIGKIHFLIGVVSLGLVRSQACAVTSWGGATPMQAGSRKTTFWMRAWASIACSCQCYWRKVHLYRLCMALVHEWYQKSLILFWSFRSVQNQTLPNLGLCNGDIYFPVHVLALVLSPPISLYFTERLAETSASYMCFWGHHQSS